MICTSVKDRCKKIADNYRSNKMRHMGFWEVKHILDFKLVDKEDDDEEEGPFRHFLIRWKYYEATFNTWEPEENLHGCMELLEASG